VLDELKVEVIIWGDESRDRKWGNESGNMNININM
jgi:hypothetical protein